MALAVLNPVPNFFDLDGTPLSDGFLYFGTANQNPVTVPTTVYWDAAGTQPVAQPVRTVNGFPSRTGSPAIIYASSDFSLLVLNKRGQSVLYGPNSADFGNSASISATAAAAQAQVVALEAALANSSDVAKGDAKIAVKRIASSAVAQLLHDWIEANCLNVKDFGAVGNDSTDNVATGAASSNAFTNARAAALSSGKGLIIPPGTYRCSTAFDLSGEGLRIYGIGHACLKYTGSGSAVATVDNGVSAVAYRHELHNLTLEGSGAANQDGLYQRNYVHNKRAGLRVRNVTRFAFRIDGDVLSLWEDCASTINEAAMSSTPTHCFYIDGTAIISDTTATQFVNCYGEGMTAYGLYANKMAGCTWNGGSFEGMPTGTGIYLSASTSRNTLQDMFCEANLVGGDVINYGKQNKFIGGTYSSRKAVPPYEDVRSIIVKAGAELTDIIGVHGYAVTVESGALSTKFDGCDLDYVITDSGTDTRILRTRQLFNTSSIIADVRELSGSATYDPASLADGAGATTTVTVTGAALGDYVDNLSFSNDLQGVILSGYVSAANTVAVRFQNESGGVLDLASGTIRVIVRKK